MRSHVDLISGRRPPVELLQRFLLDLLKLHSLERLLLASVTWSPARGSLPLQVYENGRLIYDRVNAPGVSLSLDPAACYQVKLWTFGSSSISRAVKVRHRDP